MSSSASEVVSTTIGIVRRSVVLDLGQHLAAVLAGQVEVEQDEVRARRALVLALAAQELDRLHAVGDDAQRVVDLVVLEGLADEDDVPRIVLHEQDLDDVEVLVHCLTSSVAMSGAGSVKRKVDPVPFRLASSQI
jgi:hypothetical protein